MSVVAGTKPKEVRIVDLVDDNGLIEKRTFEDQIILGPAVLVPIEDVTLDSNTFVVKPESLFIEFPEGTPIGGGIGLKHVTFRRCEFHNIAIAGSSETITPLRAQFQLEATPTLVGPGDESHSL